MTAMRTLMTRLGLTVNEQKTRLVDVRGETFDFLGYTIGRCYGRDGALARDNQKRHSTTNKTSP